MIRLALLLILSPLTIQSCLHHQRRNKIRSVHLYLERKLKILVKDQNFLLLGLWRNCLKRVPQCLPKGMYVTVTHQKITFQHLRLPVVKTQIFLLSYIAWLLASLLLLCSGLLFSFHLLICQTKSNNCIARERSNI